MNYLVFDNLPAANAFITSAGTRIKGILPREFAQYSVARAHPTNGQYAVLVDGEFDLVATIDEFAAKQPRAALAELGWFPPEVVLE